MLRVGIRIDIERREVGTIDSGPTLNPRDCTWSSPQSFSHIGTQARYWELTVTTIRADFDCVLFWRREKSL